MSSDAEQETETTVLAVDGADVTKFQTRYIKDETTRRLIKSGETEVKEVPGALADQVVISEYARGKWTHALRDGMPTKEQNLALLELVGWSRDESTPTGKQSIGTTWEVAETDVASILPPTWKVLSGTLKAKFIGFETVRGERCVVIRAEGRIKAIVDLQDLDMDLTATTYKSVESGCPLKTVSEGQFRSFYKDQDIATEGKGKITREAEGKLKR